MNNNAYEHIKKGQQVAVSSDGKEWHYAQFYGVLSLTTSYMAIVDNISDIRPHYRERVMFCLTINDFNKLSNSVGFN